MHKTVKLGHETMRELDKYFFEKEKTNGGDMFEALRTLYPSVSLDNSSMEQLVLKDNDMKVKVDQKLDFVAENDDEVLSGSLEGISWTADTDEDPPNFGALNPSFNKDVDLNVNLRVEEPENESGTLLNINPDADKNMSWSVADGDVVDGTPDWVCDSCRGSVSSDEYVEDVDGNEYCCMEQLYDNQ